MKDYTGEIVGLRETKPAASETNPEGTPDVAANSAKAQYLLLRVDKKLMALPIGSIANAILPDDRIFSRIRAATGRPAIQVKGGR